MLFIVLSALSSLCVALLLKNARIKGIDTFQLIGWNYFSALILCGVVLKPSLLVLEQPNMPWPWLVLLAVLLPSVFVVYSITLEKAGLIRTEIAQRLSLVIALIAAFALFGDIATPLKVAGILLGVVAVLLLTVQKYQGSSPLNKGASVMLLLVWIGYGVIDITLKQIALSGMAFTVALSVSFLLAFTGMLLTMLYRHHAGISKMSHRNFYLGLLLGVFNFANISLYIKAHQTFSDQPAIVFASMNILVVTLGVLAGAYFYKEIIRPLTVIALALCFSAIGLLTWSQWSI